MNRFRILAAAAAGTVLTLTSTVPSASAAPGSVLDLELNAPYRSTTALDSSGSQHDGATGSHVLLNGSYAHFDRHDPSERVPYGLDHLITVPDAADGSLDPDAGNFTVELRYRTKEKFGNVLQKGQATSAGGQVKLEQPNGIMTCTFKTPQGMATASSGTKRLNDSVWHVVRCVRTPSSVTMYVDGVRTGRISHYTGTLNNTKPWTLGGKPDCDGVQVSCDYFAGDIDYFRLTKG